eukprot:2754465-Ditylum_brightwellii.AAC.2
MQEMQTAAQELGYATANFSSVSPHEYANTTAEALQALVEATTDNRTAVANLSTTNGLLNKQLRKSTSELSTTSFTITPSENHGGHGGRGGHNNGRGNRGGHGNKEKKDKEQASINYCWSHDITKEPNCMNANCQNTKDGHQREATVFNRMVGSMEGIGG